MKRILFFTFFALIMNYAWTQNSYLDYKYSIKLYNSSMFEEFEMVRIWPEISTVGESFFNYSNTKIINPTISFQLNSKWNNFHEIELSNIFYGKKEFKDTYYDPLYETLVTRDGFNQTVLNFALRYEYIYPFNKKTARKFIPSIGFGINPRYYQVVKEPLVALSYNTSEKLFAIDFQIIPRISYFISQKLFIDMNFPLSIIDYKYLHYHVDNFVLMEELRTSKSEKTSFFPKVYCGRIGIGYKF